MNRNFIRYSRGGILLDLQNQKYHYRILKNPRKLYQLPQLSTIPKTSISLSTKQQKQIDHLRVTENQRLLKALYKIQINKGPIQQMYHQNKKKLKKFRKSLQQTTNWKKKQQDYTVRQDNTRLVHKIGQIKPIIGNHSIWGKHFQNYQKQKQQISRATHHYFDAQPLLNQTNANFNPLLRHTIDFQQQNHHQHSSKRQSHNKLKKNKSTHSHYQNPQDNQTATLNEQQKMQLDSAKSNKRYQRSEKNEKSQKSRENKGGLKVSSKF